MHTRCCGLKPIDEKHFMVLPIGVQNLGTVTRQCLTMLYHTWKYQHQWRRHISTKTILWGTPGLIYTKLTIIAQLAINYFVPTCGSRFVGKNYLMLLRVWEYVKNGRPWTSISKLSLLILITPALRAYEQEIRKLSQDLVPRESAPYTSSIDKSLQDGDDLSRRYVQPGCIHVFGVMELSVSSGYRSIPDRRVDVSMIMELLICMQLVCTASLTPRRTG